MEVSITTSLTVLSARVVGGLAPQYLMCPSARRCRRAGLGCIFSSAWKSWWVTTALEFFRWVCGTVQVNCPVLCPSFWCAGVQSPCWGTCCEQSEMQKASLKYMGLFSILSPFWLNSLRTSKYQYSREISQKCGRRYVECDEGENRAFWGNSLSIFRTCDNQNQIIEPLPIKKSTILGRGFSFNYLQHVQRLECK